VESATKKIKPVEQSRTVTSTEKKSGVEQTQAPSESWSDLAFGAMSLGSKQIQTKLTIGSPDDPYEREADRVAERVMRSPINASHEPVKISSTQNKTSLNSSIQRECTSCNDDDEVIQKKSDATSSNNSISNVQNLISSPGTGKPLSEPVRNRIEPVLGADLSNVRVHSNQRAQQAASDIQAKAFTNKNNIYLGRNQSSEDVSLMAHEATHTVQQSSGYVDSVKTLSSVTKPVIQRWEDEFPTCRPAENYAESSFHVPANIGSHEIPDAVSLHVEVPLPLLEAQRQDSQQPRTVSFILNEPVELATTSVFYAVKRSDVYPTFDSIPEQFCDPTLPISNAEAERQSTVTGPHLRATPPLPPSAFTTSGLIDVIAQTPEIVITTTYTKLAVGAASTTVLRTYTDYMLIDSGVNSIGGNIVPDLLVQTTLNKLIELNPSGHFREISNTHGHGDHVLMTPEIARHFSIGSFRTNIYQLLMETTSGRRVMQEQLREMYANQELLMQERLRQQARTQAESEAAVLDPIADTGLRQARIQSLTDTAFERLQSARTPIGIEALVPSESGFGIMRSNRPITTLPEAIELGSGPVNDALNEPISDGLRRASFTDPGMRSALESDTIRSSDGDQFSTSYIIELPNGNHLVVIPDIRSDDIVRQAEAMKAAMDSLGKPMRFRVWDATHHMQSGFIVKGSSFARMVEVLTRLTGVETRAGGPSAEAIAVSVRDTSITGDLNRSLIDPALAFLMRSIGYEIFLTQGGQDIRVVEALIGEQRVSGVVAETYGGQAPTDMLLRRAGSTLTFLQEQIDSGQGERASLRIQQRIIRNAVNNYQESVSREIGRSERAGTTSRPEVAPTPLAPGEHGPIPRIANTQAETLTEVIRVVELMDGYSFREVGQISILNEYTLIILNLEQIANLSENGREFLRNRQRILTIEETFPEGTQVSAETAMDYLQKLRVQRQLLRGVINEADVSANRTALEAELSNLEAKINATETSAGLTSEGSRIVMPNGRTLDVEVTTNQAIPTRTQMGSINRGASWLLERSGKPMGGIMVAFTLKAQHDLEQAIRDDEIPPLQALIGTAHNAYGTQVGMRMLSGIRVSPYEFVILAVMDVAQSMSMDYGSDEMWRTQVTASAIRNGIQLGLLFFAEHIGTKHPAAALISLGLMFVVDPLLEATGFYDFLERSFAFAPSDITYVDQRLSNDLFPKYRTIVGALLLAKRSPESLAATGYIGEPSEANNVLDPHRIEALENDENIVGTDIMTSFKEAYDEAATSYVGLRELDVMRAEFLRLRHMAFEGTDNYNIEEIIEQFTAIDSSLNLNSYTPEQVEDMDQWDEMNSELRSLHWEIYRSDYDTIDWDDVLESQEKMDKMFRNARYRLNPQAITDPILRTAALITPESPGYDTYIRLLNDIELSYRGVLEMARTGETYAENITVSGDGVQAQQMLNEYAMIMSNMDSIPESVSIEQSPIAYRNYIQSHDSVMRNLRRLRVIEMGVVNLLARLRFDRLGDSDTTMEQAQDLLNKEARLRDLVKERRSNHGYLFERELISYQTPNRLNEDRQLLQALSPRDQVMRPFLAEELAALNSDELEQNGRRATTVANQIALWRSQTPGRTAQIYLLHDPEGDNISGGINASAGAIVGHVRLSEQHFGASGHYRLVGIVPLNRAAIDAVGRSLHGERALWGGQDQKWIHPDLLIRVPISEIDQVLENPVDYQND